MQLQYFGGQNISRHIYPDQSELKQALQRTLQTAVTEGDVHNGGEKKKKARAELNMQRDPICHAAAAAAVGFNATCWMEEHAETRFEEGRALFEDDWTNHLSVTFRAD